MKGMTVETRKKSLGGARRVEGNWAAIAKLMRGRSVIDIVERFQTKHAFQEERENKEFPPVDERHGRYGHYPLTE